MKNNFSDHVFPHSDVSCRVDFNIAKGGRYPTGTRKYASTGKSIFDPKTLKK
jgi:hypothetical protein